MKVKATDATFYEKTYLGRKCQNAIEITTNDPMIIDAIKCFLDQVIFAATDKHDYAEAKHYIEVYQSLDEALSRLEEAEEMEETVEAEEDED